MEKSINYASIIKLILGEEQYNKFLTETSREKIIKEVNLADFFDNIFNKYCFIILMLGMSKKVEIDKYEFKTDKESFEVESIEFARKYEKYIKVVEDKKFELIRQML